MDFFRQLLANRILIAPVAAWLAAQVLKTIIHAIVNKGIDWSRLVGDGGMPSGHSATVSATAAMCALRCGADSPVFAVSVILAIITCHDAMNSRQEIGKQAAVLNKLIKDMLEGGDPETVLEEFVGHTPFQVAAGVLLGILVACAIHYLS